MDFALMVSGQELDFILDLLGEQKINVAGPLHTKLKAQADQQVKMAQEATLKAKLEEMQAAADPKPEPAPAPKAENKEEAHG